MASPFGLAYGIGAGFAGVPGAIQRGQETAQRMSLKNLQIQREQDALEEAQRKRDLEAQYEQIMTETAPMAMETVEVPNEDGTQYMRGMAAEAGIPAEAFTLQATQKVERPVERTPTQQMAADLRVRASRFREIGKGSTAFELEQKALALDDRDRKEKEGSLIRMTQFGDYAGANAVLSNLGYNVKTAPGSQPGFTKIIRPGVDGVDQEAEIQTSMIPVIVEKPHLLQGLLFQQRKIEGQERRQAFNEMDSDRKFGLALQRQMDWRNFRFAEIKMKGASASQQSRRYNDYQRITQEGINRGFTGDTLDSWVKNHPVLQRSFDILSPNQRLTQLGKVLDAALDQATKDSIQSLLNNELANAGLSVEDQPKPPVAPQGGQQPVDFNVFVKRYKK